MAPMMLSAGVTGAAPGAHTGWVVLRSRPSHSSG